MVDLHSYADDAQLYTSCSAADASTSATVLLCCINDVDKCMLSNRLRLNAEKTQFIWVGLSQMLAKTNKAPLRVGGVIILPLNAVRNLGVVLDLNLSIRNTLMASSVVATINFDNYGPSTDHWSSMLHMYRYMHSFTVESTTATPSCMVSATGLSESCNQYCMLLPIWWLVSVGTSKSRRPFVMCSTGYQSGSGSHTRLQRWRSVVFVVRAWRISLTSVRQFRQLPDVPSYALHIMVTSLLRLRNRRHLAVVAFALLRKLSGTVYQLTFST